MIVRNFVLFFSLSCVPFSRRGGEVVNKRGTVIFKKLINVFRNVRIYFFPRAKFITVNKVF